MILAFVLTMPNVGSWDGKWGFEGALYAKTQSFREEPGVEPGMYYYDFGDGWRAGIDVREVDSREAAQLRRKSKGFYGYEWMIESIIAKGEIVLPEKGE